MPAEMTSRRRFLSTLGTLSVSAVAVGHGVKQTASSAPAATAASRIPESAYVELGRIGMRVSPVAAGLSVKAEDLVRSADAGINYFDTAEKYLNGQHNRMVGEALKGRRRESIFISAKFQDGLQNELTATTDQIVRRVHECLERLGTTYIDCMLIHNVQRVEALDNPAWLAAYQRLKADGKVRWLGASTHDPKLVPILERAIASNRYDLLLVAYNPAAGGDLYGSPGWPAMLTLLEHARAKNIAVATMKIMIGAVASGVVKDVGPDGIDPNDIVGRGKYLDARVSATRWVLSNPAVHVVQYTMTGPGTVAAAVDAATSRFRPADAARARAYHEAARGRACPIPCAAPCQTACPSMVAIADILRHRMYYEHFGLQKQAMLEYAALPVSVQADACRLCESQACTAACPSGRPVKVVMRDVHETLALV